MFRNYLTVAVRNLVRHKGYSLINIAGLAIGMACCILIFLYVQHELSYDRFHENADQLYRVINEWNQKGTMSRWATSPSAYAPHLLQEFPEIRHAVRMSKWTPLLRYGSNCFKGYQFVFADSSLFDMFSFPLLQGNPKTALKDPFSLVLTETTARKFFGDEAPLGKIITYDNRFDFKVTGIVQEAPSNSHLQFNYLASFISLKDIMGRGNVLEDYGNFNYHTYLLLPEHYPPAELEKKFPDYLKKFRGETDEDRQKILLQPITDIHLSTTVQFEKWHVKGDMRTIYTFSAIALFILLIACINFVNLSTARSANRAREVGIRKVVGAHRLQLIKQLLGESLFLAFLALPLAMALAEIFLPVFNGLAGRTLSLDYGNNAAMLLGFLAIGLFVGVVAGSYPAFYLSSFPAASVLKGTYKIGAKSSLLRRMLIVVQFTISIGLIIGTVIVLEQFYFMKAQKLGFDKEHVIFTYANMEIFKRYEVFKQELLQNPSILRVTAAHAVPGRVRTKQGYSLEGEGGWSFRTIVVDPDYLETLGLELVAGRNFSRDITSDEAMAYILNEAAVRKLGCDAASAVEREFWVGGRGKGHIIGVVRDFHFQSLHQKIEPLVLRIEPGWFSMVAVKISPGDVSGTLDFMKQKWEMVSPAYPFSYRFLDTDFDRLYKADERLSKILGYFTLLGIFIACLGLFGLTSFATEQRTKEIGIRKILGASISGIVLLLSKEFTKLVLVSNLIAWPVAYWAMNRWLQDFAYCIHIGVGTFLLAGVLALIIALLTVSFQAIKAATANPVKALRYE